MKYIDYTEFFNYAHDIINYPNLSENYTDEVWFEFYVISIDILLFINLIFGIWYSVTLVSINELHKKKLGYKVKF